ncbi:hypothetical protein QE418_003375 [Microbacterium testaceum]|uniref:carbohydrate binding domain-containing protein n=1 Tax=Microbacterium TaxID=33882 RepID=UPI00277DCECB|nr:MULTISPECIES: carbohydrate binding domain-containing protein [Microbacterium]MDQ1113927.1 hypothetical protein [Microbacterium testaceum]MDR6098966.1 hypothetical protein [Microbacterium sp. SORGH_AS_0454]
MFDVRLRLAAPDGTKGRVLATERLTFVWLDSAAATVKFDVKNAVAEQLETPQTVLVEYSVNGGPYRAPRNDMFIVTEDEDDNVATSEATSFTGINYYAWLMQRMPLWWKDGDTSLTRRYENQTPGEIMRNALEWSRERTPWAPYLKYGFNRAVDALGNPWDQRLTLDFPLFTTSMSRILQSLVEQGYLQWWTDGHTLQLLRPDVQGGEPQIVLGGPGFTRGPSRSLFEPITTLVVQYDAGWTHFDNPGADNRFGAVFQTMSQSGVPTREAAEANAQPTMTTGRALQREQSYDWVVPNWKTGEPEDSTPMPFAELNVGDYVQARTKRGKRVGRVVGLTIEKADGKITARATVGDKILSTAAKLARRTAAATVGTVLGGSGAAVPSAPSPAGIAPSEPQGVRVVRNVGEWAADGTSTAEVAIAWNEVTQAVDLSRIDVEIYEVWSREANQAAALTTSTDALSAVIRGWTPGVDRFIKVRARSRAGRWSEFSEEISVTPEIPASIVPKVPTGLKVKSNDASFGVGGTASARVTVQWDAVTLSVADAALDDVAYVVELDDALSWTALVSRANTEASFEIPAGSTRHVRVRAVAGPGVQGDPTAPLTVVGAVPALALEAPSKPILSTGIGIVTIGWDGKLGTGAPGVSFQRLRAQYRIGTGEWTEAAAYTRSAGQVATARGTVGANVEVRLIAEDTLGRPTSASASASITVAGIGREDLTAAVTDAIDKAGQDAEKAQKTAATADGRLTVSASAPVASDATGKPAGAVWFRRDAANRFIGAWELVDGAWAARSIENAMIATVDAGKVNTGFLNADRIAANSMTLAKLLIGSFTNLAEDPGFEANNGQGWTFPSGSGSAQVVAENPRSGARALKINPFASPRDVAYQAGFAVEPGEEYLIGAWVRAASASVPGAVEIGVMHGATAAAATASSATAVAASPSGMGSTYVRVWGTWKVPAGAKWARPRIVARVANTTNVYYVDDFEVRLRVSGELIVDGGVKARHINVEDLWANQAFIDQATIRVLRAGVIETSMLAPGFGDNLDLAANGAVTILTGQLAGQAQRIASSEDKIDGVDTRVSAVSVRAGEALGSANAAASAAALAQAAAEAAQKTADRLGTYVRIDAEGLTVGSPGTDTTVKISDSSISLNVNGVAGAWIDAGQMIAPRFVGTEVDLANTKITKQGNRTVVRRL